MPELPEVETIVTDLKRYILNAYIKDVIIEIGYRVFPNNKTFIKVVENQQIIGISRIAKNVLLDLSNRTHVQFHLAMTGRILIRRADYQDDPWKKVTLVLEKNKLIEYLRFCDMRMFGKVVVLNKAGYKILKEKYGPEILNDRLTAQSFFEILQTKKVWIKKALLDQSIVAGLGNIYANDVLWMAKINPEAAANSLSIKKVEKLLISSRELLKEAIQNRGATLQDEMYVDVLGKPGKQQNFFRIYGKAICSRCKSKTVFKQINGRGTFFCPNCQN